MGYKESKNQCQGPDQIRLIVATNDILTTYGLMPTPPHCHRLQRHWMRYCLAGVSCLWAARFMYRHSKLAGSDDLERYGGLSHVLHDMGCATLDE